MIKGKCVFTSQNNREYMRVSVIYTTFLQHLKFDYIITRPLYSTYRIQSTLNAIILIELLQLLRHFPLFFALWHAVKYV